MTITLTTRLADLLERWGLRCRRCGFDCDCPMSIRPRNLDRMRALGPAWDADDLLAPAGPRITRDASGTTPRPAEWATPEFVLRAIDDAGDSGFGRLAAGRGALPPGTRPNGDAAQHLRQLVVELERFEQAQAEEAVAVGIHAALVLARSHAARAGVL